MSQFNFPQASTVMHLLAAVSAADTAAATGAAVDILAYEGPIAIIQSHGVSTGTLDGKIQDSADGSTDWQDVAGATFAQATTTAGVERISVQKKACRRYIRYLGTVATGPQVVAVTAVGVKKTA
jgi:hypothetical protein